MYFRLWGMTFMSNCEVTLLPSSVSLVWATPSGLPTLSDLSAVISAGWTIARRFVDNVPLQRRTWDLGGNMQGGFGQNYDGTGPKRDQIIK